MKNLSVPLALVAVLVVGLICYGNNQQTNSPTGNPLRGKVVLMNPSSISKPRENARIEVLADKKFVVYPVKPDDGNGYDSWIAIDEVSRMRVFNNMEDAKRTSNGSRIDDPAEQWHAPKPRWLGELPIVNRFPRLGDARRSAITKQESSMNCLPAFLLGSIAATTCIAQEVRMPPSDPSKGEAPAIAVSDEAEQHALRVRGMKAAVADIETNQLWILNEVRAQR